MVTEVKKVPLAYESEDFGLDGDENELDVDSGLDEVGGLEEEEEEFI